MITELPPVIRKRDGRDASFDPARIEAAITAAFCAELGLPVPDTLDTSLRDQIHHITEAVVRIIAQEAHAGNVADVERVQDLVEMQLMRDGYFSVARRYIVYRQERARSRALRGEAEAQRRLSLHIRHNDGSTHLFDPHRVKRTVYEACHHLPACQPEALIEETFRTLYDGMTADEVDKAQILAARSFIEREPDYNQVATRLLLNTVYREVLREEIPPAEREHQARQHFACYVQEGVDVGRIAPELLDFDLPRLATALHPERDEAFTYLGLQTLADRYLLTHRKRCIELPQHFWMRVAMGLSLNEGEHKNDAAIEFYETLSTFRFVSATPTLFNAGTLHPQLSSCYLSTVEDDLHHIFKVVGDNAQLSKWAGGLGNDWTNIRATGSQIKGTNGESQGIVPFLKIVNDTAVAVNQGGKRKGAVCSYLETWHLDIEEFLELRKNTGDDRRRTHDMHTANWIPDLFMQRVAANGQWTLFSPCDVPDLHDLYGKTFEARYMEYERMADNGDIEQFRRMDAVTLWRKMLSLLFETGHPWITFKDPSNLRSPQDHVGVVHNSNLCTEILLNTSREETAVCNLGSVNLVAHLSGGELDKPRLARTVRTAVRMLDNVIDINFYPTPEARNANGRHRPIGLGIMGFQDALFALRIPYASDTAITFADESMEFLSYHALLASSELAKERGTYPSYSGSKWDRGLLPIDTLDLLANERTAEELDLDRSSQLDWTPVREQIARYGMRNSNTLAIAPTATISNIVGVSQSIEPLYRNLFVKSNLSGDFTVVNAYLVSDLKQRGLWDDAMRDDLKYYDGSVQSIARIPDDLKELYRTAFEVEPHWLIECASRRQKWMDMGQSLNLYMDKPQGKTLHEMYFLAWRKGLKTTYYLRCQGATQVEKSNLDVNRYGVQPRWMQNTSASARVQIDRDTETAQASIPASCPITDPACEACQ